MLLIYSSLLVISIARSLAIDDPIVTTSLGQVQGHFKTSYNGRTYSAFEGIPYAKSPVGDLRFEAPVSPESWNDILNATATYTCMQVDFVTRKPIGTEDCLYLNVYVPNQSPTSNDTFDVVVHIHGGAFSSGNPNLAGPKFIMDKEIVYVNLNYRLGVLGFLSTEDDVIPGNNGLKDQAMALRWVQQHINKFGGNPNSVTIVGLSAGGASVHLHYFSQNSKGLFHRGISSSGNALMSIIAQNGAWETAKKLAALVGCKDSSTQVFRDCMKEKSAEEVVGNVALIGSPAPLFPLTMFPPVVEIKSNDAFLLDYPYNLLKAKKFHDLPWINTICEREGILGLIMLKSEIDNLDLYWNDRAQYYMDYNYTVCETDKLHVAQELRQHYFGNKKISLDTVEELINIFGDRYFAHSFEKSSRKQALNSKSPVYTYIYNYTNSFVAKFNAMVGLDKYYGVGHAEDGQLMYDYNFDIMKLEFGLDKNDELMKDKLLNIITSFAKTNVPTIDSDWDPVGDSEDFSYLFIQSPDKIEMVTKKEVSPTEFWDNLPILENEKVNEKCK